MSADRGIGLVLLAVAGVYGYLITRLPAQRLPDDVGEALFPWLITGAIVLIGLALFVPRGSSVKAPELSEEDDGGARSSVAGSLGIVTVIAMAAYIFMLPYAGFFISTSLFAVGLMRIGGSCRLVRDIAVALIATLVIQTTFTRLLLVPLPIGHWLGWFEW
jgi:putative tricarboxylic transport membrane protein